MNFDFSKIKVLIVGDIMIDRYMTGDVLRQSPEADIPVLENIKTESRLGGAANVALNIKALGATPYLCGVLGDDENTKIFKEELHNNGLDPNLIIIDNTRKTTVKTRLISNKKHLLRVDREDTFDLNDDISAHLIKQITNFIASNTIDLIIFQDYNKGVLTKSNIAKIISIASEYNVLTAVDPKKLNFFEYKNMSIFKPNRIEIEEQLGAIDVNDLSSLRKVSKLLRAKTQAKNIFITLSEDGIYYDNDITFGIVPTNKGTIVDVSGAGDSVISIICLGLINNWKIREIAKISNIVGLQVCGLSGVVSINRSNLLSEIGE